MPLKMHSSLSSDPGDTPAAGYLEELPSWEGRPMQGILRPLKRLVLGCPEIDHLWRNGNSYGYTEVAPRTWLSGTCHVPLDIIITHATRECVLPLDRSLGTARRTGAAAGQHALTRFYVGLNSAQNSLLASLVLPFRVYCQLQFRIIVRPTAPNIARAFLDGQSFRLADIVNALAKFQGSVC